MQTVNQTNYLYIHNLRPKGKSVPFIKDKSTLFISLSREATYSTINWSSCNEYVIGCIDLPDIGDESVIKLRRNVLDMIFCKLTKESIICGFKTDSGDSRGFVAFDAEKFAEVKGICLQFAAFWCNMSTGFMNKMIADYSNLTVEYMKLLDKLAELDRIKEILDK